MTVLLNLHHTVTMTTTLHREKIADLLANMTMTVLPMTVIDHHLLLNLLLEDPVVVVVVAVVEETETQETEEIPGIREIQEMWSQI